jgi:hypothetical protein
MGLEAYLERGLATSLGIVIFKRRLFQSAEALQLHSQLGYPESLVIFPRLRCLPLAFSSKVSCKILQIE